MMTTEQEVGYRLLGLTIHSQIREKLVEYQEQIDKIENYQELNEPLAIKYWSAGRKAER